MVTDLERQRGSTYHAGCAPSLRSAKIATLHSPLPAAVVASDDPDVTRGAKLFYEKGCLYCHEVDGRGGHRGPDLTAVGRRMTEQQMILRVDNGGHNMPAFAGVIDRDNLRGLVAFLRSRR